MYDLFIIIFGAFYDELLSFSTRWNKYISIFIGKSAFYYRPGNIIIVFLRFGVELLYCNEGREDFRTSDFTPFTRYLPYFSAFK